MAHVRVRRKQRQTLAELGMGGVVLPGSLAYDCYPQAAVPLAFVTGASDNVDTAYQSFVANGAITSDYIAATVAIAGPGTTATAETIRLSLRRIGGSSPLRRVLDGCHSAGPSNIAPHTAPLLPLRVPASIGIEGAVAVTDNGAAQTTYAYLSVVKQRPLILPDLMRVPYNALQDVVVTTATGGVAMAASTAWAYGAYSQLTAGIASPILITAIIISSAIQTNATFQVALATGAAASEVDVGVFGYPPNNFNASGLHGLRYPLPFPIYVPASIRLAARMRVSSGAVGASVNAEYLALPIAV
jgi:hypothetical protein